MTDATNLQHCHCQSPRFTNKATNKTNQSVYSENASTLPCGWTKDGLQTFNQLAKEVYKNRNEHGEEFDKAFQESIQEEMASTNTAGKRKRNCIETYNDLNEAEMIVNKEDEENSGDEEQEQGWVSKNVFMV